MISLNCTICQIPCPTIVTGSPTIILSVNRVVLKTTRCDCCDHVPHPIVTLIYRDVTTLCLVYTTQIPLSQFAVHPNGKWPKSGRTQMKIRMWVHCASSFSLGQHPIVALQPLILLHTQWPVLPAWFKFFICTTPWIITIRISKKYK